MFNSLQDPEFACFLASQRDGLPLKRVGNYLMSGDGRQYPIRNGIADILLENIADEALDAEIATFKNIPIEKVCYFRSSLFDQAFDVVDKILVPSGAPLRCMELGGGEGYFAAKFKRYYPKSESYVCDVSMKHLENADNELIKIRGDIRKPYLLEKTISVASFWVSLHHLDRKDIEIAVEQASKTLVPGGVLIVFEPNHDFLPRRIFMESGMKKDVYFDNYEKPLRYEEIKKAAISAGLSEAYVTGHNPPYNPEFLKLLKNWVGYYLITELFRYFEIIIRMILWKKMVPASRGFEKQKVMLHFGSYIFAIFKKS